MINLPKPAPNDAYGLILNAIDTGIYKPGDRLVESELADRFGVSRTPIREALQRLETQSMLTRDGRSLIVASLNHNQMAELYSVRGALEGLAAELAAQHAAEEEIQVLQDMVDEDRKYLAEPGKLSQANRRFHRQIHLASHNSFLVRQLDLVYRSMALLATTSLAAEGRGEIALAEHQSIVDASFVRRFKMDDGIIVFFQAICCCQILQNCFGIVPRETGHRRVPEPPARIIGVTLKVLRISNSLKFIFYSNSCNSQAKISLTKIFL